MKKEMLSMLFRLPAEILIAVSFLASVYVAIKGNMGISWFTPIFLFVVNVLYFWGRNMTNKNSWDI
jgi:hypothetical protein